MTRTLKRLAPGYYNIPEVSGDGTFSAHSYLFLGKQNVLIDPGSELHETFLENALEELGNPKIHQIILTHDHWDHKEAAQMFPNEDVKIFGASLQEGDAIDLGEFKLEVMHTPGHTIESMCLYESSLNILICGDTVFANGGIARIFETGDERQYAESLERLVEFAEKTKLTAIYPGHGEFIVGVDTCLDSLKWSLDRARG